MKKISRNFLKVPFLILIIITFISWKNPFKDEERRRKDELYQNLEIFTEALQILEDDYVKKIEPKKLIYGALKGMLSSLDSHSEFLNPDEYKDLKVQTSGEFGGLGIEITIKDKLLTIITPLEGTPAWEAGIKPGDIIVKIEGELTKNITLDEAVKKLRGKPGTKVTITILREDEGLIKDITITRQVIKIKDIKETKIINGGIAYIKLSEFRETTARQLDASLGKLKSQGMQALILDLRNNPGGLLESAVEVSSRFLKPNSLVVYTQEKNPKKVQRFYSKCKNPYLDIPIVVLVNKGSASGSEIVAACFKDYKRAIILGQKTFGKGSVQTVLGLSDGSAIRFTTSYYYSPRGNIIQDKGVSPDVEIEHEYMPLEETKKSEEIFEKIERKEKEPEELLKDYQILQAFQLLKGILVYEKRADKT